MMVRDLDSPSRRSHERSNLRRAFSPRTEERLAKSRRKWVEIEVKKIEYRELQKAHAREWEIRNIEKISHRKRLSHSSEGRSSSKYSYSQQQLNMSEQSGPKDREEMEHQAGSSRVIDLRRPHRQSSSQRNMSVSGQETHQSQNQPSTSRETHRAQDPPPPTSRETHHAQDPPPSTSRETHRAQDPPPSTSRETHHAQDPPPSTPRKTHRAQDSPMFREPHYPIVRPVVIESLREPSQTHPTRKETQKKGNDSYSKSLRAPETEQGPPRIPQRDEEHRRSSTSVRVCSPPTRRDSRSHVVEPSGRSSRRSASRHYQYNYSRDDGGSVDHADRGRRYSSPRRGYEYTPYRPRIEHELRRERSRESYRSSRRSSTSRRDQSPRSRERLSVDRYRYASSQRYTRSRSPRRIREEYHPHRERRSPQTHERIPDPVPDLQPNPQPAVPPISTVAQLVPVPSEQMINTSGNMPPQLWYQQYNTEVIATPPNLPHLPDSQTLRIHHIIHTPQLQSLWGQGRGQEWQGDLRYGYEWQGAPGTGRGQGWQGARGRGWGWGRGRGQGWGWGRGRGRGWQGGQGRGQK